MDRVIKISYGLHNAYVWKWVRLSQVYCISADTERERRPLACGLSFDGLHNQKKTS